MPRLTINIDADIRNADWTKQTWDLPATNVQELRTWIRVNGDTVAKFKQRPIYTLNVAKLPWLKKL